ncbi:hypothetical protein LE197_06275 [Pseudomonas sp. PS1(2021)]|uniref:cupin domain-containing protein n=1 Tax=Pseudomonas sp. PS1(2021) TaxID=2866282 RepID=UPI001CEFFEE5|nr:hypothetical protein [Pseudomonas sp. PS1(2021)]UCM29504.1 hypothetical protein LE197_06275 [Pseudomonas sp. PS1(2021)]
MDNKTQSPPPDTTASLRGPTYWMNSPGNTPKEGRREFHAPADIPWTDWLMPGTRFKLLYCNLATGSFTLLLQVDPNVMATSHWHIGNLQVYILEGGFYYGDGHVFINGERLPDFGLPNTFTVETAGTVHQPFTTDTGCLMLAMFDGPIGGYMPDGQLAVVADARLHYYMARDNNAARDVQLIDYAHGSTDLQPPASERGVQHG